MVTDKIKATLLRVMNDAIELEEFYLENAIDSTEHNCTQEHLQDLFVAFQFVDSLESYNPERLH